MDQQVLFIQGAGQGAYEEDKKLVASLCQALGAGYDVRYPALPDEGDAPYERCKELIEHELTAMQAPIILVGHSVGGSILAKFLSETEVGKPIAAIFLLETPFWGGDGWRYEGYEELELPQDATEKFPRGPQLFLYHCRDDEVVPFDHLAKFARVLPHAHLRELDKGGHQLNNDLSAVAEDIKGLEGGAP